jgi:hypothetical protein
MKLLSKYRGDDFTGCRPKIVWSPVLPRDLSTLVANEQTLVQNGIHSRRRAGKLRPAALRCYFGYR